MERGSRRARHVAANNSAAAAAVTEEAGAQAAGGSRRHARRGGQETAPVAHAITTPGTTAANAIHTPPALQHDARHQHHRLANPPLQRQTRHRAQQPGLTPNYSHHRTPEQSQQALGYRLDGHASPPGGSGGGIAPHPFRLHRTANIHPNTRLSMPYVSDDSGSEPDVSILAMARARNGMDHQVQPTDAMTYDDGMLARDQYDVEDTSIDDRVGDDEEEHHEEEDDDEAAEDEEDEEEEEEEEEIVNLVDPATIGLKEISNLGRFTVSSHKPGNGVEELRSDDLKLYWQSDGPQPHKLTVYFVKRVGIRDIRFFVDYNEDESYTPTKIVFKSGTSENNLIEFATMTMDSPVGWQQVPVAGAGGEPDGHTLVSYVLQMQILENHQNGKDTHLRGIKIYAFDADATQGAAGVGEDAADRTSTTDAAAGFDTGDKLGDLARSLAAARIESGEAGFAIPDFMREPELR